MEINVVIVVVGSDALTQTKKCFCKSCLKLGQRILSTTVEQSLLKKRIWIVQAIGLHRQCL